MPIALVTLLSLAVFVSGFMTPVSNTDEWNIELFLQKGWNL